MLVGRAFWPVIPTLLTHSSSPFEAAQEVARGVADLLAKLTHSSLPPEVAPGFSHLTKQKGPAAPSNWTRLPVAAGGLPEVGLGYSGSTHSVAAVGGRLEAGPGVADQHTRLLPQVAVQRSVVFRNV